MVVEVLLQFLQSDMHVERAALNKFLFELLADNTEGEGSEKVMK